MTIRDGRRRSMHVIVTQADKPVERANGEPQVYQWGPERVREYLASKYGAWILEPVEQEANYAL